ncbi:MAG TPA: XrtA/PEP-CTERM system-associated ATPase [Rhodocyclaceae bacterium]|nr:XrtA/PEP-CTERM system-associated ATPase [Rhodocyclaceae bacterium]
MYEAFYGLTSKPFQLNPDPSFYFGSKQHRRATAYLEYGMHQNEGFIVVTGEVGAGKTTVVRGLLDGLDRSKVVAAHLVSTQLDADDTLRLVSAAFGIRTKDVSKSDLLMALEAFLVSVTGQGKRCLLIVDEAQNLTPRAVEELRMLSNFQFSNHALLQSFLVGQPEFRQIMQSPHMQQLRQRVIASCHIGPLSMEETQAYIEHRLKCAGSQCSPEFEPEAFAAIYKASGGIPRRINSVCDRLLLMGFLEGKTCFSGEDVENVAREIYEETQAPVAKPGDRDGGEALTVPPMDGSIDEGDWSGPGVGEEAIQDPAQVVATLSAKHVGDRLLRLERSLLRLEHINSVTLGLLRQLFTDIRKEPLVKDNPL